MRAMALTSFGLLHDPHTDAAVVDLRGKKAFAECTTGASTMGRTAMVEGDVLLLTMH